jgi:hypothetical protein
VSLADIDLGVQALAEQIEHVGSRAVAIITDVGEDHQARAFPARARRPDMELTFTMGPDPCVALRIGEGGPPVAAARFLTVLGSGTLLNTRRGPLAAPSGSRMTPGLAGHQDDSAVPALSHTAQDRKRPRELVPAPDKLSHKAAV